MLSVAINCTERRAIDRKLFHHIHNRKTLMLVSSVIFVIVI